MQKRTSQTHAVTPSQDGFDHEVDVLIVGSGNGAMTAALCCYELGITDVLLIEKGDKVGGTSAISGGGVWIPCNRYAKAAGAEDSLEDAREYLRQTTPSNDVPGEMLDTYINIGPKMIDFLHERTRARYISLDHYPDYYTDMPGARHGHRSMEPEPVDASELGGDFAHLYASHHMMRLLGRIHFTQTEAALLTARLPGWAGLTMRLVGRALLDLPWLIRWGIARRLCTGCAGVARLWLSLKDRHIPLWRETPMTELITDASGEVIGVVAAKDGGDVRIRARKAVILAAGGFEHNQEMRECHLPQPTRAEWSAGCKTNTGDAIREGMRLGAATRLMDGAWWCMTLGAPGEPSPRLAVMEKSYPGSCVVNASGKRIGNESQNYMAYQHQLFDMHSDDNPCVPAYQIFDARFRSKYLAGPLMTPDVKPDWTIPKAWFEQKFVAKADSLDELAKTLGIHAENLKETVAKMNDYAATGKDLEFGRGDVAYDRYYGDPRVKPNPCLAPIDEPPFYAMRLDPGDFGTHGGLATDTNAQVLRQDGSKIDGLYAIGNCSAAILPTYPGPGATLGPAMTFGYQAARHIAGLGSLG